LNFIVGPEENENNLIVFQTKHRAHLQSEPGFPDGMRVQFPKPQSSVASRIGEMRPEIDEDSHQRRMLVLREALARPQE
jgi:hypothetical protein